MGLQYPLGSGNYGNVYDSKGVIYTEFNYYRNHGFRLSGDYQYTLSLRSEWRDPKGHGFPCAETEFLRAYATLSRKLERGYRGDPTESVSVDFDWPYQRHPMFLHDLPEAAVNALKAKAVETRGAPPSFRQTLKTLFKIR